MVKNNSSMSAASGPLAIAHRGGAGLWPENTMEAFTHAIDMGADGLEVDLQITKDGIAVVHHDERLRPEGTRTASGSWLEGPGPLIADLTAEEVQSYDVGRLKPSSLAAARAPDQYPIDGAKVPRFSELLTLIAETAKPDFKLYPELKTDLLAPTSASRCREIAKIAIHDIENAETARPGIRSHCRFVSFDWRTLAAAREIAPDIPCAYTTLAFAAVSPENDLPDFLGKRALTLREMNLNAPPWYDGADWQTERGETYAARLLQAMVRHGADQWFAYHEDVTFETAELAQALGLSIAVWTVDEPKEMRRLAGLGVEAILSDRPDRLLDTLS